MSKQAINVNVNVGYWFQGTGLTGQNLSEHNQNKFTRVATKYKRKTGQKLSKIRCYKASRVAAQGRVWHPHFVQFDHNIRDVADRY